MTRWKALAIHLTLSALVIGTIAAAAVWLWYPPGLFESAKAGKLLLTLAAVDIVLGPLLTLIVYKQGKKSLKFDLTVIAMIQLAALGYGLHAVWQSRPVYLVAATDRFQLVFANEIDREDLQYARPEFQRLPQFRIKTIAAVPPKSGKRQEQALFSAAAGKDVYEIPVHYVPYDQIEARKILTRARPTDELLTRFTAADQSTLRSAINASGLPSKSLLAVPIDSARGSAMMLLDARDGRTIGPVAIDPWYVFNVRPAKATREKGDAKRHQGGAM